LNCIFYSRVFIYIFLDNDILDIPNHLSDSDDDEWRMDVLEFHGPGEGRIKEVKVKPGSLLSFGKLILVYQVMMDLHWFSKSWV
jgi:hypothetical protein